MIRLILYLHDWWKKLFFTEKAVAFDILLKSTKYRGNTEALIIIADLEKVSKIWENTFPISFYIADCDEKVLNQILYDLGYHNPIIKRKCIGRDLFSIMIRPRG